MFLCVGQMYLNFNLVIELLNYHHPAFQFFSLIWIKQVLFGSFLLHSYVKTELLSLSNFLSKNVPAV